MIEKNIRLEPHHSRDLLVGRRSDGRRPGYQPPGHGTGGGRGRDPSPSGPPGGGDRQMTYTAPAPAPDRQDRARQQAEVERVAEVKRQEAQAIAEYAIREAKRIKETKPAHLGDTGGSLDHLISTKPAHLGDTGGSLLTKKPEIDTGPKIDVGFQNIIRKQKIAEDLRQKQQDPNYGQFFRPQPVVEKPSGIMSKVGGGLKKVFGDNPLEWAVNAASLGGYQKAKYAKALLDIKNRKGIYGTALGLGEKLTGKKLSLASTQHLKRRPKGMPEHLGERGFKTRVDTPEDRDGPKTIAEQVTQGAGLEEGQKMLGLDDKQIQQIYQGRDLLKQTIESGMYQDRKLTMDEIKMLQAHMMKMESLIQNIESYQVRSGSAYGGRIDKALGGRSRDIG